MGKKQAREAFPPELPPLRRYTLCGDSAFENQVKQDLSRLSADAELSLAGHVRALLLVGRFARGEGSVISKHGEAHAFPGYHCAAVVGRIEPDTLAVLEELSRTWTEHLHTPVWIKAHPLELLTRKQRTLWRLDWARGGVEVLAGDASFLQRLGTIDVADLHSDEAGWLLTEQAALLAIALEDGSADGEDIPVDRVTHLIHNLALACGDAEQLLHGQFAGGLRARLLQLKNLQVPTQRWELYESAIHFLFRPDRWKPDVALETWKTQALAWLRDWHLELEARRAGAPSSVRRYIRHREPLFVHRPRRARLLRWPPRPLMPRSLAFPYVEDQRERLARAAVALAYEGHVPASRLLAERLTDISEQRGQPGLNLAGPLSNLYQQARLRFRSDPVDGSFYV